MVFIRLWIDMIEQLFLLLLLDGLNFKGWSHIAVLPFLMIQNYSAFTETGATQTMKTNQMAELKQ